MECEDSTRLEARFVEGRVYRRLGLPAEAKAGVEECTPLSAARIRQASLAEKRRTKKTVEM